MIDRLVTKIERRARRQLSGLARDTIKLAPIRSFLEKRYRQATSAHLQKIPRLTSVENATVQDMRRQGMSLTTLDELGIPGSANLMKVSQALVDSHVDQFRASAAAGIDFLMLPPGKLLQNPEIFQFGLSDSLLNIAEAYLGLPVAFDGVSIQYTVADGREVSTREWHRDREDRKMVKLIVYLNEVDTNGGPFQLFCPPSTPIVDKIGYLVLDQPGLSDSFECTGKAGTVIFADTANFFHRGKPAISNDRAAVFFSYIARCPQRPFFCDRSGIARSDVHNLVTGLTQRQQDAALWREALPLPWRWIPCAPVL